MHRKANGHRTAAGQLFLSRANQGHQQAPEPYKIDSEHGFNAEMVSTP